MIRVTALIGFIVALAPQIFASSVVCHAVNTQVSEPEEVTFFVEDGVIFFLDFEGGVSYPFSEGVLCNVPVRKALGETAVETTEKSPWNEHNVSVSGFIVNQKSDTKVLASSGLVTVNKFSAKGFFRCSFENEKLMDYKLYGCVIKTDP